MRVRCIGHACLEIEVAGLRILTDPWWAGPAYTNQWYPWPVPRPSGVHDRKIDYLYISHGHNDHLHPPTLQQLPKNVTVLVPQLLAGDLPGYLRYLGFENVIEISHGQTLPLARGLRASCYTNLTDSMLVLDDGKYVLVNGNDALHASPPAVIDRFCRLLRRRHPIIDALFLGYGGASWFPNCIRLPGKDDIQQGRAREELFVSNFLRVTEQLEPKLACAFAASFVLLEPHNRWINEVKMDTDGPDIQARRRKMPQGTRCHMLLPDDVIEGLMIRPGGCARPSRQELARAYAEELREGCARAERLQPLPPETMRELAARLELRLKENRSAALGRGNFALDLRLRDNPGNAIRIECLAGTVKAQVAPARDAPAVLELRAEILEELLENEYGIESIFIGYGAVATLQRAEQYRQLQTILISMSSHKGSWRSVAASFRRTPAQTSRALWRQRWPLALHVGARLGLLKHFYEAEQLKGKAMTKDE